MAEMVRPLISVALENRLNALQSIRAFDPPVLDQLVDFIDRAEDSDLFRLNPYDYAHLMGLSRHDALELFLYATHTGIFDFTWGVLCPTCAAFITTPGGLRSIQSKTSCYLCRTIFDSSIDDNIEVAFTIAPAIRAIRHHRPETVDFARDWMQLYLSNSVNLNEHMRDLMPTALYASTYLNVGDIWPLQTELQPGNYAILAPRHHTAGHLIVRDEHAATEATFDLLDGVILPDEATLKSGPVTINVRNRIGQAVMVGLLRHPRDIYFGGILHNLECDVTEVHYTLRPFLTGTQLVNSQTFLELFKADSIPSEGGLEFKSLAFLFSDLKGSTAMYDRVGDFNAYGLVRQHFTLLRDIIAREGGAMVKTIGDAVMASFPEAKAALRAAIAMREDIQHLGSGELELKIGIHNGASIAVESNERLDYFGQTVNIAARTQNEANAQEIVITEAVYRAAEVQDIITAAGFDTRSETANLKGVGGAVTLYRLQKA